MAELGRPTDLTDELTLQIRRLYFEGLNWKKIQEALEIPAGTWDVWMWKDHKDFRKTIRGLEHEKMVETAKEFSKELMTIEHTSAEGRVMTDILKVKQKEAEFLRETLGKADYSKRNEMTGAEGKDLSITFDPIFQKDEPTR